jgi:RNA polymerase sigma-70 factor (ECF subfamily)
MDHMPYHDDPAPLVENVKKLRRYAIALLGNTAEAEDLLQDCLVRALARRKPWSNIKDPRAYLFTIMHNLFVDFLAKRRRLREMIPIDTMENVLRSPARQLDRIEVLETERALRRLPGEQKEVLLLIGLEGMSYKDAAAILGVPQGTVMSRLSRARQALRDEAKMDSKKRDVPGSGQEKDGAICLDIEFAGDGKYETGGRVCKNGCDNTRAAIAQFRGRKFRT